MNFTPVNCLVTSNLVDDLSRLCSGNLEFHANDRQAVLTASSHSHTRVVHG